ncbi:hypothetical protein T09_6394 [Trichinella sp. T9]|nr:hypothetical protein T09_6394 [Trichinella sp. T9]
MSRRSDDGSCSRLLAGGLKLGNGLDFNSTNNNFYGGVALLLFSAGPACWLVTDRL